MYSYGPPHMAEQKQDDQLEHTYSSYVRIRDVALKTCQRQLMIGRSGERGSGISMLVARHHDDDDDCYLHLIILFNICWNPIIRISRHESVLTCVIMNYEFKWDYMDIGMFRYSKVAESIVWTVIGCWLSEWIY